MERRSGKLIAERTNRRKKCILLQIDYARTGVQIWSLIWNSFENALFLSLFLTTSHSPKHIFLHLSVLVYTDI